MFIFALQGISIKLVLGCFDKISQDFLIFINHIFFIVALLWDGKLVKSIGNVRSRLALLCTVHREVHTKARSVSQTLLQGKTP